MRFRETIVPLLWLLAAMFIIGAAVGIQSAKAEPGCVSQPQHIT